jgi:tRNA U55 pseudouridine synthase TruB
MAKIIVNRFSNCEKIYEFGLLIGISTKSDDRLGEIQLTKGSSNSRPQKSREIVNEALITYAATLSEQQYHIYSAKTAKNKENVSQSLWWWTQENRLDEIEIPRHACEIKELEILTGTDKRPDRVSQLAFLDETIELLRSCQQNLQDFKVEQIIQSWINYKMADLSPMDSLADCQNTYDIINVRCRVTGGTFIRQICRDLISITGIPILCTYIDRKTIFV